MRACWIVDTRLDVKFRPWPCPRHADGVLTTKGGRANDSGFPSIIAADACGKANIIALCMYSATNVSVH